MPARDLRIDGARPDDDPRAIGRPVLLAGGAHPLLSWSASGGPAHVRVAALGEGEPVLDVRTFARQVRLEEALEPFRRYEWSVTTPDGTVAQEWFESGPLSETDWHADWIAVEGARAVRLGFTVPALDAVRTLRLHVAAQGLVALELDGRALAPGRSEPVRSHPDVARYRTYALDELCEPGDHSLILHVGRGDWAHTPHRPRVRAQVTAMAMNAAVEFLATTSAQSRSVRSRVVVDEPFYREVIDHRVEPSDLGTATPLGSDALLRARRTVPDTSPPVRTTRTIAARPISSGADHRVFDVGENIAGRARLQLRKAQPRPGHVVRVRHGEHLDGAGRVDTRNLTLPADAGRDRQLVEHILAGDGDDTLETLFAVHGFRYVDVSGVDEADELEVYADVIHSHLATVGDLATDDPTIDALWAHAERTALNTMHGIPEDCPTREQAGWTGDAAAVADYTFARFELDSFAPKWIDDLRRSQRPDGSVPAVAPDVRDVGFDTDPVWGSALLRMTAGHLMATGDATVAEETLPALRRWADYLLSLRDESGLVVGAPVSYGHDWLALAQTPPEILHTSSTIEQLDGLADLERRTGDPDRAREWEAAAGQLRSSFRAAFVRDGSPGPTGSALVVGSGSQGSLACAVVSGVLSDDERERALDLIEDDIVARGHRVSTGYAATRPLIDALGRAGRVDSLRRVLDTAHEPGIGAMLRHGHRTFWECWWVDPANTGTGSLDHIGLGGVFAGWLWRWVAGLAPVEPGYARVRLSPRLPAGLGMIRGSRATPRGILRFVVQRVEGGVRVEVDAPESITGEVSGPDGAAGEFGAGHSVFELPAARTAQPPRPVPTALPEWAGYPIAVMSPDEGDATILAVSGAMGPGGTDAVHGSVTGPLRCMPVPHAQLDGPLLALPPAVGPRGTREVTVDAGGFAVTAGGFAFAYLDFCDAPYSPGMRATLTVIGDAGTTRSRAVRLWPAGWNRAAVDLHDWPPDEPIVRLALALEGDASPDGGHATMHVGRFGVSPRRRSW